MKGLGLAISGIVLPILMIPLLLAILLPSLFKARNTAQRVACASNLKQLGTGMILYANDNKYRFPTPSQWCDLLKNNGYTFDKVLLCPLNPKGRSSYAVNPNATNTNCPGDMVLLFETSDGWNKYGGPEIANFENHKGDGLNVIFVNSDVRFVKPKDVNSLRWTKDK